MLEVTKNAPQTAIIQLGQAFQNHGGGIWVDLGVSVLATPSNGEEVIGPKALGRHLHRMRHLSRRLSREEKGWLTDSSLRPNGALPAAL